jgi:putative ABC transport system permease protein
MIRNYFLIAFRNLLRQRFYSAINIAGLGTGIAVSLLILYYIYDEHQYDRFHTDADRMYQVYLVGRINGVESKWPATCAPLAQAARAEIPEVENTTRIGFWREVVIRHGEQAHTEQRLMLADSNFLDFFTFELIEGNPERILREPNQIVLTESSALKYFGYRPGSGDSPVGRTVLMGTEKTSCSIVGILRDPPRHSHFTFGSVLSMENWDFSKRTEWTSNNLHTYFKLLPGADLEQVNEKLHTLVDRHVGPEIQQFIGMSLEQWRAAGDDYGYHLQPITAIRLRGKTEGNIEPTGDIAYVYLLSAISLFIILIACINFMNLSTARSMSRAREVGIRKTVGALNRGLVQQFMLESLVVSGLATLLAFGLIALALPFFNQISGKAISFHFLLSPASLFALLAIWIVVGFLAGSYPAFYLSAFRPAHVLKGQSVSWKGRSLLRSGLVVFQFAISVALIVCTLLIYKQLQLVKNKNLGFDKENVLVVNNVTTLAKSQEVFRESVRDLAGITGASLASSVPPGVYNDNIMFPNGHQDKGLLYNVIFGDEHYLQALGLRLAAGRFFSAEFPSDSMAVVINRSALAAAGWESHEGQYIVPPTDSLPERYEVIGVLEDFNFETLRTGMEPLAIFLRRPSTWTNRLAVRLQPGHPREAIESIRTVWNELAPGEPFDYGFVDDRFEEAFRDEERLGRIFIVFTALAILISCLGLFGLATYSTSQRTVEIGIRKALGSSSAGIVLLLSRQFTTPVLIGIAAAVPISLWLMNWWLNNFAYKASIDAWSFVGGGFAALFIAWVTISAQSLRAATRNPATALRSE